MRYTQDMIAVMQAFCDGKNIQARQKCDPLLIWQPVVVPQWDWVSMEYRIKKTKKTYYMGVATTVASDGSRLTTRLHTSKDSLLASGYQPQCIVEVILEE